MKQSLRIIRQAIETMPDGPVLAQNNKVTPPRGEMKQSMEALIHHFKLYTEGFHIPEGDSYTAVEAPKGEFGVYLVADGTNKPYRARLRAPDIISWRLLIICQRGHMLADRSRLLAHWMLYLVKLTDEYFNPYCRDSA